MHDYTSFLCPFSTFTPQKGNGVNLRENSSLDGAQRNPGSELEPRFDPGLRLRLHPGYY